MDKILELIKHYEDFWEDNSMAQDFIQELLKLQLHLTQKTTVPKDGEMKKWDWVWLWINPWEDKTERIVREMNKCWAEQWNIVSETLDADCSRWITIIRK